MFDEPLSNLDFKLRVQMREELRSLQRRLGKTSIYVTHDQTEALALSDRIAVLSHGQIEQIGSPPRFTSAGDKLCRRIYRQLQHIRGRVVERDGAGAIVETAGVCGSPAMPQTSAPRRNWGARSGSCCGRSTSACGRPAGEPCRAEPLCRARSPR